MSTEQHTEKRPMFTSYFANWRQYPTTEYQSIGIVRKVPDYFHYFNIPKLAPPKKMARYLEDTMRIAYREYLDNELSAKRVCIEIAQLCGDKIPVLLCYERPHEFCHRHILREWLTETHGVNITELGGIPDVQLTLNLL